MKRRHAVLFALLLAATVPLPSWASSDPIADVRQIMAGTVTTTKIKNDYLVGKRDGDPAFQGALKAYKAVRAAEAPAPTPAPIPTPVPTKTWVLCSKQGQTCTLSAPANVRYGAGTVWTAPKAVTGSIDCNDGVFGDPAFGVEKVCQTDGTPVAQPSTPTTTPTPTPPPPTTVASDWIAAPLTVGGYAFHNTEGACCGGLIYKLLERGPTDRNDARWTMWRVLPYADPSGNYPLTNPALTSPDRVLYMNEQYLTGVVRKS